MLGRSRRSARARRRGRRRPRSGAGHQRRLSMRIPMPSVLRTLGGVALVLIFSLHAAGVPAHGATIEGVPGIPATSSPAADLRVNLDRLMAEHTFMSGVALQKMFDGAPDLAAA